MLNAMPNTLEKSWKKQSNSQKKEPIASSASVVLCDRGFVFLGARGCLRITPKTLLRLMDLFRLFMILFLMIVETHSLRKDDYLQVDFIAAMCDMA